MPTCSRSTAASSSSGAPIPILRAGTRAGLRAEAQGPLLVVRQSAADEARVLLVNFSPAALPAAATPALGPVIFSTAEGWAAGANLPGYAAVIARG